MSVYTIAARYAKSLMDLAVERNQLPEVHKDVSYIHNLLEKNRELFLLFKSPIVNADKKTVIAQKVFGGHLGEITTSFVDIIIKKRREEHLASITQSFLSQYNVVKNVAEAKLTIASDVSDEMLAKFKELVKKKTGSEDVELTTEVDEKLIGGFVLEYDNNLIDASISGKLEDLRQSFIENKYVKKY